MEKQLFNPKTVKRLCSKIKLTLLQKKAAKEWLYFLDKGKLKKEKLNYFRFGEIVLKDLLGYDIRNMDFEEGNIEFSFKNKEGKSVLAIEAKGTKTKDLFAEQKGYKEVQKTPIDQLWNYIGKLNLDYGIATNYKDFVLIDRLRGSNTFHFFDFEDILGNEAKLKEFVAIFSKEQIIDNNFVERLEEESAIEERNFTKEFYKLFHETRLMLIKEFKENGISKEETIHFAQLFLNRLMFAFFAEDTDKLEKRYFEQRILQVLESGILDNHSTFIASKIRNIFQELDKEVPKQIKGFNGELFKEKIPSGISFKDFRDKSFFAKVYQHSNLKKDLELDPKSKIIFEKYQNRLNPIIKNLLLMASFDFKTEVSVNILGHIFEQSLSDLEELKEGKISKRKKEGIFYTPEFITEYICRNTIIPYLSNKKSKTSRDLVLEYQDNIKELEEKFSAIKILDPACGSGAFLIKAIDILLEILKEIQLFKQDKGAYTAIKKGRKKKKDEGQLMLVKWNEEDEAREIIENNIFGVDINEEYVEITKLSLFLKIAKKNKKLMDLSKNIKCGNSLIDDPSVDSKAFNWEKEFPFKFDIVIGNPPYVRVQNLKHEDIDFLTKNYKTPIGKLDISILFFEKSLDLINENGIISFISSSQWVNTDYGKNLRNLLVEEGYLAKMLDFGSLPVFEEVDTYPSIFVLNKQKNISLSYVKLTKDNYEKIQTEDIKFKKIEFKNLSSDSWQFSNFNLVRHLDNKGLKWNELNKYGKAYIGNITGYDKAFIVDKKTISEYNLEKGILIPYAFKGDEVVRYTHTSPQNYVIYPYNIVHNKQELISEKELKSKYPNIFNHLFKFKNELRKRKDSRKLYADNDQWYKHVRPGSFDYIKPKKIHIKGISTKLEAGILNENMNFSGANCPAIILFINHFIYEILGILNSKLISFYLNNICPKKLGGYIRYNATNISKVPIMMDTSEKLKSIVTIMLKLNKEYYDKKDKFFNRIKKSFNLEKINKKLDRFYELEFNDFIKEIEKLSKKKIPLKEQDEWEDYFKDYKKELLNLKNEIEKTDKEIDELVYKLYGITEKEKNIIEENLK